MAMNLHYRSLTAADLPELTALGIASYGTHASVLGEDGWSAMKANLSRPSLYTDLFQQARGFVCEHPDGLAGMVFLLPSGTTSLHFPDDWAHIRLLGVAPEFQGRGISRALMQHCIDAARDAGERVLGLHTAAFMKAAQGLYRSLGFIADKELARMYDQPYTRFRLELQPG